MQEPFDWKSVEKCCQTENNNKASPYAENTPKYTPLTYQTGSNKIASNINTCLLHSEQRRQQQQLYNYSC